MPPNARDANYNMPVKMGKKVESEAFDLIRSLLEIIWALLLTAFFIAKDIVMYFSYSKGKSLAGQHVLVTGGGRGLGREICEKLSAEGCRVSVVDVDAEGCKETTRILTRAGGQASWKQCDITDKAAVSRLFAQLPAVDILVNNAGIVSSAPLLSDTEKSIERMMQVNVMSHFWTLRAVLPGMIQRGRGHIVAVASAAGFTAASNIAPYTATKYAVTGMMASLREELRQSHPEIKTTCVHPFFISPPRSSVEHWDRTSRIPDVTATEVAAMTVRGIKLEKATVTVPSYLYYLLHILHLLPTKAADFWRDLFPVRIASLDPKKNELSTK